MNVKNLPILIILRKMFVVEKRMRASSLRACLCLILLYIQPRDSAACTPAACSTTAAPTFALVRLLFSQ